jgi:hypothetical protein
MPAGPARVPAGAARRPVRPVVAAGGGEHARRVVTAHRPAPVQDVVAEPAEAPPAPEPGRWRRLGERLGLAREAAPAPNDPPVAAPVRALRAAPVTGVRAPARAPADRMVDVVADRASYDLALALNPSPDGVPQPGPALAAAGVAPAPTTEAPVAEAAAPAPSAHPVAPLVDAAAPPAPAPAPPAFEPVLAPPAAPLVDAAAPPAPAPAAPAPLARLQEEVEVPMAQRRADRTSTWVHNADLADGVVASVRRELRDERERSGMSFDHLV